MSADLFVLDTSRPATYYVLSVRRTIQFYRVFYLVHVHLLVGCGQRSAKSIHGKISHPYVINPMLGYTTFRLLQTSIQATLHHGSEHGLTSKLRPNEFSTSLIILVRVFSVKDRSSDRQPGCSSGCHGKQKQYRIIVVHSLSSVAPVRRLY